MCQIKCVTSISSRFNGRAKVFSFCFNQLYNHYQFICRNNPFFIYTYFRIELLQLLLRQFSKSCVKFDSFYVSNFRQLIYTVFKLYRLIKRRIGHSNCVELWIEINGKMQQHLNVWEKWLWTRSFSHSLINKLTIRLDRTTQIECNSLNSMLYAEKCALYVVWSSCETS